MRRRHLEQRLSEVADFKSPDLTLEQYRTPAEIAASVLHAAATKGDLSNRLVIDLGCGTGMLIIGASFYEPTRAIGIDRSRSSLEVARGNARRIDPPTPISWLHGDVAQRPICAHDEEVTVVMNPPFGSQHKGADRPFLEATADIADVSYSIHNRVTRSFIEDLVETLGGSITEAYAVEFDIDNQYPHHRNATESIEAIAFRIEWGNP